MKRILILFLCVLVISTALFAGTKQVNILGIADYHSHALPFYSEGQQDVGGIARLIGYLKKYSDDENTLIFSSGDTINYGTPAWSDKYKCVEWPWFNNIIDAMAYGNHDSDYGPEVFANAVDSITYPVLGANVTDEEGQPIFEVNGKNYVVFERNEIKVGVFALAGDDFDGLVKADKRPVLGAKFTDRKSVTEEIISEMKAENVDVIVLIGHATTENDIELAKEVKGIDLILGSHSHLKQELERIDGTDTYMISPFQYGTYISSITISVDENGNKSFEGKLIAMTSKIPEDKIIKSKVTKLQAELEKDPKYANLFENIGEAAMEISVDGQNTDEAGLGNLVTDLMRRSVKANMALSTSSSFRASIAPGKVNYEQLKTAIPYKNFVYVYEMTGSQIRELVNVSFEKFGTDNFSQISGLRVMKDGNRVIDIEILKDSDNSKAGFEKLNSDKLYKVATTNYQGLYAADYKDVFSGCPLEKTEIDVQQLVIDYFKNGRSVRGYTDGRIREMPEVSKIKSVTKYVLNNPELLGDEIVMGMGSGLCHIPGDGANIFYSITDRGPNGLVTVDGVKRRTFPVVDFIPSIFKIKIENGEIEILKRIPLKLSNGIDPITGNEYISGVSNGEYDELPYDGNAEMTYDYDPYGLDLEGIAYDINSGNFWICDEYRPSIVEVKPDGTVLRRIVPERTDLVSPNLKLEKILPEVYSQRVQNRGFEGVTITPDGKYMYAVLQNAIMNGGKATASSRTHRIVKISLENLEVIGEYLYIAENCADYGLKTQKDFVVSDIFAIDENRILVDERDKYFGEKAVNKRIYIVDLKNATNILGKYDGNITEDKTLELLNIEEIEESGIKTVAKEEILDLVDLEYPYEKIEGLVLLNNRIYIINDNDFSSEIPTELWEIEFGKNLIYEEKSDMRIGVFADSHIIAKELKPEGKAFEDYLNKDRKVLKYSVEATEKAIEELVESDCDVVMVCGDLTKDGELISHEKFAEILRVFTDNGKQVYVINGNHDINNPAAYEFDGEKVIPTPSIDPEQFREIYWDMGYSQAIAKDINSLSYVVEPVDWLRIIAMDSCVYGVNYDFSHSVTGGKFREETLNWIKDQIQEAKKQGKMVIGFMHHGIVEHFDIQDELFAEYVIENWGKVAEEFAQLGMNVVFTGHFHAQDVSMLETLDGNKIYDVQTGSLVTYPIPFRVVDVKNDGEMVVKSERVEEISNYEEKTPYGEYTREFIFSGIKKIFPSLFKGILMNKGMSEEVASTLVKNLTEEEVTKGVTLLDIISGSMVSFYEGDENPDEITSAVISRMGKSLNPIHQQVAGILANISSDPGVLDNDLTIQLEMTK